MTDLNDIVQSVVADLEPSLSEGTTVLTVETSRGLPAIRGDRGQLTRVVATLLRRAEHSAAAAGRLPARICVRTWEQQETVHLSVSDNGILGSVCTIVDPGLALSLCQCADIVANHHGKIYSWRAWSSQITVITVILPID